MFHLSLLAAVLAADVALAEPAAPVLVGLDMEVGRIALGCYALWTAPASGDPVVGADGYPDAGSHREAGVLLDVGGVPFRTWVTVDFEGRALSFLDGDFGVGFTPRLWLRPDLVAGSVGGRGAVSFAGDVTVGVRGTKTEELLPVTWSRGFAAGSDAAEDHIAAWSRTVPVATEGKRGPYRWTVRGTITVDLHVYGAPAE